MKKEPELAALIMRYLATWSLLDSLLTGIVGEHLLKADFRVANEFVYAVPWSKRRVLIANTAYICMAPADAELLERALIPVTLTPSIVTL